MLTRRAFLRQTAFATAVTCFPAAFAAADAIASFFVVGDTHYRAAEENFRRLDPVSAHYNRRLIDWLNKLPGTAFSRELGGLTVPKPHGVVHAGDIVDSGDEIGAKLKKADTEMAAFTTEWGLNGTEGRLRWPVREVHGNHDAPRGETVVTDAIKSRNQRRAGLINLSPNGLHYSWDWAGVHFVALGIVVGGAPEITRRRHYAPLGSLTFLQEDLAAHVGKSGRPVVVVHHVDAPRYSETLPDDRIINREWDYGDVHAYYSLLREYRVAAAICGHTHTRNVFRWDGTNNPRSAQGVPFLNTDNAALFYNATQAFLHVSITRAHLFVREFATNDGWITGAWTPQVWKFDLA